MALRFKLLIIWSILVVIAIIGRGCEAEEVNIEAVIEIESGGDPNAYNERTGAIGLMQITKVCLDEFNNRPNDSFLVYNKNLKIIEHQKELEVYNQGDLYDGGKNVEVGTWYLNQIIPEMLKIYKIPDTIDNRLWAYNAGMGNVKKGIKSRETINYIKKYHKLAKEKQ